MWGLCSAGAADAVVCNHHALGGEGAADLGRAVIKACEQPSSFKFLYDLDLPIKVCLQGSHTERRPDVLYCYTSSFGTSHLYGSK